MSRTRKIIIVVLIGLTLLLGIGSIYIAIRIQQSQAPSTTSAGCSHYNGNDSVTVCSSTGEITVTVRTCSCPNSTGQNYPDCICSENCSDQSVTIPAGESRTFTASASCGSQQIDVIGSDLVGSGVCKGAGVACGGGLKTCGQSCTSSSECANPSPAGVTTTCSGGICQNASCIGNTTPGANCACGLTNRTCGQTCGADVGLCATGSTCSWFGPSCSSGQTYCMPVTPQGGYAAITCTASDRQQYKYIADPSGNPISTQSQLQTACSALPTSVCPTGATSKYVITTFINGTISRSQEYDLSAPIVKAADGSSTSPVVGVFTLNGSETGLKVDYVRSGYGTLTTTLSYPNKGGSSVSQDGTTNLNDCTTGNISNCITGPNSAYIVTTSGDSTQNCAGGMVRILQAAATTVTCGSSCDSTHVCETGHTCSGGICKLDACLTPGACSDNACTLATCGDAVCNQSELCERTTSGGSTYKACQTSDLGSVPTGAAVPSCQMSGTNACRQNPPVCGDGVVNGTEACDPLATPTGCSTGQICSNSCACVTSQCGASCSTSTDCPTDHTCTGGKCVLNGCTANNCANGCTPLCGGPCTTTTDCPVNHTCTSNKCVYNSCTSSTCVGGCPSIPNTAIIDDKTDPILFGIITVLIGMLIIKFDLVNAGLDYLYSAGIINTKGLKYKAREDKAQKFEKKVRKRMEKK